MPTYGFNITNSDKGAVVSNGFLYLSAYWTFGYMLKAAEVFKPLVTRESRILVLGYGLGYGPAHVYNDLGKPHMTAVDLSPEIANHAMAAHNRGMLKVDLFIQDAYEFVSETTETWDHVIVDLFQDSALVPRQFLSQEFADMLFGICASTSYFHILSRADMLTASKSLTGTGFRCSLSGVHNGLILTKEN